MTDTTTNDQPTADLDPSPALEHVVSAALGVMRRYAERRPHDDDYWNAWIRHSPEQRPMIVLAVVLPGQTDAWLITPNSPHPQRDGVLAAHVNHAYELDEPAGDWGDAEFDIKTALFHDIAERTDWLMRARYNKTLHEMTPEEERSTAA